MINGAPMLQPMHDHLTVGLRANVLEYREMTLAVRTAGPNVLLFIDGGAVELTTTAAHQAGFALVKKSSEALAGDGVIVTINAHEIALPPEDAKKVGAALLRKADDADDWQRANRKRN